MENIGPYQAAYDDIGPYRITLDHIRPYRIILYYIGSYWTISDRIGLYRIILDYIGSYWTISCNIEPYRTILDCIRPYQSFNYSFLKFDYRAPFPTWKNVKFSQRNIIIFSTFYKFLKISLSLFSILRCVTECFVLIISRRGFEMLRPSCWKRDRERGWRFSKGKRARAEGKRESTKRA